MMQGDLFKAEEVVAAIELLAENNDGGKFTVSQVFGVLKPGAPCQVHNKIDPQYARTRRVMDKLVARGEIKDEGIWPGTYSHVFSLADKGIDHSSLGNLFVIPRHGPPPKGPEPEPPLAETPTSTSAPPYKPLLLEDVEAALAFSAKSHRSGIAPIEFQQTFFREYLLEKVRQLLNYLCETGRANTQPGPRQSKLYFPATHIPAKYVEVKPEAQAPIKIDKSLAFRCEVCSRLVGVRAMVKITTEGCTGCDSEYMIHKGWAYRLYLPVQVLIWTPSNAGGTNGSE